MYCCILVRHGKEIWGKARWLKKSGQKRQGDMGLSCDMCELSALLSADRNTNQDQAATWWSRHCIQCKTAMQTDAFTSWPFQLNTLYQGGQSPWAICSHKLTPAGVTPDSRVWTSSLAFALSLVFGPILRTSLETDQVLYAGFQGICWLPVFSSYLFRLWHIQPELLAVESMWSPSLFRIYQFVQTVAITVQRGLPRICPNGGAACGLWSMSRERPGWSSDIIKRWSLYDWARNRVSNTIAENPSWGGGGRSALLTVLAGVSPYRPAFAKKLGQRINCTYRIDILEIFCRQKAE